MKRTIRVAVAGALLVAGAIVVNLSTTDTLARWRAARLSEGALDREAARPSASVPVLKEWARRQERQGRFVDAAYGYGRATHLDAADAEAWVGWGRTAYAAGNWKDAEAILAQATRQWPSDAEARFAHAAVLTSLLRFRAARDELAAGTRQRPARGEAWTSLGDLELRLEDPPGAVDAYRQAMSRVPGQKGLRTRLGRALVRAGRIPEAQKVLEMALRDDPSDMDARLYLGVCLGTSANLEDRTRGIQELNRVTQFAPTKSHSCLEIAKISLREKDLSAAAQSLQQAMDYNPCNVEALRSLVQVYREQGRQEEVQRFQPRLQELEKLDGERKSLQVRIEAGNELAPTLLKLVPVELALQRREEAAAALSAAAHLEPSNPLVARWSRVLTPQAGGERAPEVPRTTDSRGVAHPG